VTNKSSTGEAEPADCKLSSPAWKLAADEDGEEFKKELAKNSGTKASCAPTPLHTF
jgi:hypothetical protein